MQDISLCSLKNSYEFNLVFKNSVKVGVKDFFSIYVMKLSHFNLLNKHTKSSKLFMQSKILPNKNIASISKIFLLGLSISKKIAKANKRNLIKRRLRHIVRVLKVHSVALIFIPYKNILDLSFEELKNSFESCFKKAFFKLCHAKDAKQVKDSKQIKDSKIASSKLASTKKPKV